MHGQYIRSIDKHLISEEDTFLRLSKGDLKAGTESEIVAAQDQALHTKRQQSRLCHQFEETVDHIMSACPILAKEQHIK
jgi:hypothetical protein